MLHVEDWIARCIIAFSSRSPRGYFEPDDLLGSPRPDNLCNPHILPERRRRGELLVWAEQQCCGLTNPHISPERPYLPGHEDKTRFQSVWFTKPNDVKGTAFLNVWAYDQREFPDLFGYLPAFKRVRRFPTNQRFEPLVSGMNLFLSDVWAAGDPMLTWGNYKIVGRQPMLASMHHQWLPENKNWAHPTVG